MYDLKQELRKLDPHRTLSHLHYNDHHVKGESVTLNEWTSLRYVTETELSNEYIKMTKTVNPVITIEVTRDDHTYWLIIPIKHPTSRHIKSIHVDVLMSLTHKQLSRYCIRGTVLPCNRALIPDGIVPLMGDFYGKI